MTRVGVLIVSAPDVNVKMGQRQGEQVSHFLDKCFFCKKELCQIDERFMYGDVRAFCTPECRFKQIAVDKEKEKVSKQSTGTKTEFSRKNDLQYRRGAQPQKHAY
ncbi:PREDICTED: protein MARD1 [Theobroma cacao]|uniref:Protein MARD1 n=1 Tax=Theobroma cacao TaxID=3641 RepID=A0AB32VRK9_THECC|nr:PREDICTED: protein MARD1 [Theobroma cacao]